VSPRLELTVETTELSLSNSEVNLTVTGTFVILLDIIKTDEIKTTTMIHKKLKPLIILLYVLSL
jgi:hypothetical protein